MRKTEEEAFEFLEELPEKTMQWESFNEKLSTLNLTLKGGIYSTETSIAVETKIVDLMRRIEALEVKGHSYVNQVNQIFTSSCLNVKLQIMCWRNIPC